MGPAASLLQQPFAVTLDGLMHRDAPSGKGGDGGSSGGESDEGEEGEEGEGSAEGAEDEEEAKGGGESVRDVPEEIEGTSPALAVGVGAGGAGAGGTAAAGEAGGLAEGRESMDTESLPFGRKETYVFMDQGLQQRRDDVLGGKPRGTAAEREAPHARMLNAPSWRFHSAPYPGLGVWDSSGCLVALCTDSGRAALGAG